MTDLIRDEIKYVRDGAKAAYAKAAHCYICGTTEELQFHHFYSVTQLWNKWKKENSIDITCVDDIMGIRDTFIEEHHDEIYNQTVTLCSSCHNNKLHRIYGKSPPLFTAMKQKRWTEKQKIKFEEKHG